MQAFARELRQELCAVGENDASHHAGSSVFSILQSRPSAVRNLAHEKLHVYAYKEVPLCWRRVYEDACLWETVKILEEQECDVAADDDGDWITKIVQLADSAIIFAGAPLRRGLIDELLGTLTKQLQASEGATSPDESYTSSPANKRRRLNSGGASKRSGAKDLSFFLSTTPSQPLPCLDSSRSIVRLKAPSLSAFGKHLNHVRTPLVITGSIHHWPAVDDWKDPQHWLNNTHGGRRLVPVELGRSYTDEGWGQKIMPFGDYLRKHVLRTEDSDCHSNKENNGGNINNAHLSDASGTSEAAQPLKGYLAQHDLLGQIPALRNDITIPDYCYLEPPRANTSDDNDDDDHSAEPQLNIWLGPGGTISPAHTDPHENILAQVVGRKYVRLFAPDQRSKMYPMGSEDNDQGDEQAKGVIMSNTAHVDVGSFVNWSQDQRKHDRNRQQGEFFRSPSPGFQHFPGLC